MQLVTEPRLPDAGNRGSGIATELVADPFWGSRIVHVEAIPARDASHAETASPLTPEIRDLLVSCGIVRLWSHQARAIDLAREGCSVALASGTGSGKSLAYVVPALEHVLRGGTALLLFPTKALARDQLRKITALRAPFVEACVVDGDSPTETRAWARRRANVILTNPDMLHQVLLPDHTRWAAFFKRLALVALDETHVLRGIFGSHVAHVLRRLRRVAAHHGSDPTFVCTSATLGDAEAVASLCDRLTGTHPVPVVDDGSPRPAKTVLCWNPPFVDVERGIRQSPVGETGRLLAHLVSAGLQTLAFTSSRKATEIVAEIARRMLGDAQVPVVAYRGGFLAEERREIEDGLTSGEIRGIAATNALELGMDVAGLDATVLCGFPGTVSSFRQQIGRAGRGSRSGLAILVAGPDQLDQWYMSHPDELFARPCETVVVNPGNPRVREPHLACAAFEIPLRSVEPHLGGAMDVEAGPLVASGRLRMRRNRLHWSWSGRRSPARSVGIRSSDGGEVEIVEEGSERRIGTVDRGRAAVTVHPGAVYLHQGERWLVSDLDLEAGTAIVARTERTVTTQPRTTTEIEILDVDSVVELGANREPGPRATIALGRVQTTRWVLGYRTLAIAGHEDLRGDPVDPYVADPEAPFTPLDLPPQVLDTRAFWISVPDRILGSAGVDHLRVPGTVHACEHTVIGILPRFAICDRWDLGGVSMATHPETGLPTWFVYDGYQGGAGLVDAGFRRGEDSLRAARDLIDACPCISGCPSCVQSPKCGNWNDPLDKDGALLLLAEITGGHQI